jgi:Sulfate permease and related transporters (MFS superfamily)
MQTATGTPETPAPQANWLRSVKNDLLPSFVVFLIAIPLSLGIALASGAPILAGLVAAAVGGIVVGLLGGAPLQVSGPAAGLTVLVYGLAQQFEWPVVCAITLAAGVVQILLGALKIARGALAISPAVVHGMLAGIGITIALAQLHVVLGGAPQSSAIKNLQELPGQVMNLHGPATFLGLLTIGILIAWLYVPKRLQSFPGPLLAVLTATVLSVVLRLDVKRVELPENLLSGFTLPRLPAPDQWGTFLIAVITIALIASVESLLSAVATDKMHSGSRADLDREMIGQGAGNAVSGLLGGLPITGVIVRSSANISAGAQTKASAILHGVWIIVATFALGSLIQQIPLASLAGLLVFVGTRLVNMNHIRELRHHREAPIYFITVAGVVGMNLLYGVGLGIAAALFMLLRRLAAVQIHVEHRPMAARNTDDKQLHDTYHVRIDGSLTFISVPQVTRALGQIPQGAKVDIDLMVDLLDHAAFEAIHDWRLGHERSGGTVDIDELHEAWYQNAENGTPSTTKTNVSSTVASLLSGRRRRRRSVEGAHNGNGNGTEAPHDVEMVPLLQGVRAFYESGTVNAVKPILSELAEEQRPEVLFITCCDSRVVPTLFTLSGPGDLFKVRNIGNLVPHYSESGGTWEHGDASVGAAIEYAVEYLKVESIVVCGHSRCGAMQAVINGNVPDSDPNLGHWLKHAAGSKARLERGEVLDPSLPLVDQLGQINVVQQLDNLRSYPVVRKNLDAGTLRVIGLFFDIPHAQVLIYDPAREGFYPVAAGASPLTDGATSGRGAGKAKAAAHH